MQRIASLNAAGWIAVLRKWTLTTPGRGLRIRCADLLQEPPEGLDGESGNAGQDFSGEIQAAAPQRQRAGICRQRNTLRSGPSP